MSPEQQEVLRAELTQDPEGHGYATHLPDDPARVVDLLTQMRTTMTGALRSTTAKAWAAAGPYARIVDASNDADSPCRASCLVIRDSFACGDPIHLEDPRLEAMLAGWVACGIATEAEFADLYELAQVPASRADVLGIPAPTARDIVDAWSNE
ncbi:hypothetical protein [Massilia sp.]|uniref:hypothetical protein n=1 Tax=Massilia sp. TaxID=1882437 RepID=UPI00352F0224